MIGGLASPPASHSNSPVVPIQQTVPQHFRHERPCLTVNPKHLLTWIDRERQETGYQDDFPEDDDECSEQGAVTEAEDKFGLESSNVSANDASESPRRGGNDSFSNTRSRLSLQSSTTAMSDNGKKDPPLVTQFQKASLDPYTGKKDVL